MLREKEDEQIQNTPKEFQNYSPVIAEYFIKLKKEKITQYNMQESRLKEKNYPTENPTRCNGKDSHKKRLEE